MSYKRVTGQMIALNKRVLMCNSMAHCDRKLCCPLQMKQCGNGYEWTCEQCDTMKSVLLFYSVQLFSMSQKLFRDTVGRIQTNTKPLRRRNVILVGKAMFFVGYFQKRPEKVICREYVVPFSFWITEEWETTSPWIVWMEIRILCVMNMKIKDVTIAQKRTMAFKRV